MHALSFKMLLWQFKVLIKQGSTFGFDDQKSIEQTMQVKAIIAQVLIELYLQFTTLRTAS
jgi:hypothetical protein